MPLISPTIRKSLAAIKGEYDAFKEIRIMDKHTLLFRHANKKHSK